jgi:hypothetical protein
VYDDDNVIVQIEFEGAAVEIPYAVVTYEAKLPLEDQKEELRKAILDRDQSLIEQAPFNKTVTVPGSITLQRGHGDKVALKLDVSQLTDAVTAKVVLNGRPQGDVNIIKSRFTSYQLLVF